MKKVKIIFLLICGCGIIIPFIPAAVVVEFMFLLIAYALIFIGTTIYLIASFLIKEINSRNALITFLALPIFILAQILSGYVVHKVQLNKSEKLIVKIEESALLSGAYPEQMETPMGITYSKINNRDEYRIDYSRGFMITEKYYSKLKTWKSYGWND